MPKIQIEKQKRISESLIGLENLSEIVETALFTPHLTQTIPISLILIGPSGAGKSKLIMQYREVKGSHLTNDVTSMGLQELLAGDPERRIRFLIIPDFNVVLSHRASTLQLTIANLLSVTSEGTVRIDDGRAHKETKHDPLGILTAMTRDLYANIARKWAVLGFNRRFLPIYYEYGFETRQKIQTSISNGDTTLQQLVHRNMVVPRKPREVRIPSSFATRIQTLSDALAENIGWVPSRSKKDGRIGATFTGKQLEFSPHLALRSFARAHALRARRDEVKEPDFDFLLKVVQFTRYDRPGIL